MRGKAESVKYSPFVSISNHRSQRLISSPHRSVEHLRLQLTELHLQFRVVVGQSLDNGRVPVSNIWIVGSEILVARIIINYIQSSPVQSITIIDKN